LRSHSTEIAQKLKEEVHERLQKAGVEVLEARLSHLAYSPEIAQAMLQRQQASAVLAARRIIVQGAVGMVSDALQQLAAQEVVELDSERRATMVSNLLVVLCGDQGAKPVINAGSIY
jgi:regulator of protease activity HflC (stomatin/prohibitin superfamily)